MILNTLDIVLEPADLQNLLTKVAGQVDKIKELNIVLENGVVVLGGKISVGFAIPFSTKWKAQPFDNGHKICLTLSGVSVGMVGMGEEMISGQVLSMLKDKLEGHDAVSVVDKDIIVDLKAVLQPRGITLNGPVKSIAVTPAGIELVV